MADLVTQYYDAATKAYAENQKRMEEAKAIYDRIISMYGDTGAYGAAYESLLKGQKVRDIGEVKQRDIGRGLYGIRPYEAEWEQTVGTEARLKLEDIKSQRLGSALQAKAEFLTGIQQPYPDYSALQQAAAAQAAAPTSAMMGGGGGGGGGTEFGEEPMEMTMTPYGTGAGAGGYYGPTGTSYTPSYTTPVKTTTTASQQAVMALGKGPVSSYAAPGIAEQAVSELVTASKSPANWQDVVSGTTPDLSQYGKTWEVPGMTAAQYAAKQQKEQQQAPAATAELMNQYDRYRKGLKKQGITAVADYATWYRANYGKGATAYLSAQRSKPIGQFG